MADVSAALKDWSATTASNSPAGGTTIGTGLDDNLREIQGAIVRGLSDKGADIASATTTDLGAVEGLMHDITGTTTITGFGTVRDGIWKIIKFEGALTLTHNATSLILPGGANITTADGDTAIVISEGSGNWRCVSYVKATGLPINNIVLGTAQATTSGTSIDFTGIPAGVKEIKINFVGVSTNNTSPFLIQIGDSGGIENTTYVSGGASISGGTIAASTAGFIVGDAQVAARLHSGTITLSLENASGFTWCASGMVARDSDGNIYTTAGHKSLSAVLDRVRITTVAGTATFDAGEINISYE
jgi:hypothetical protein